MFDRSVPAAMVLALAGVVAVSLAAVFHTAVAPDATRPPQALYMVGDSDREATETPITWTDLQGPTPRATHAVAVDTYRVIVLKVAVDALEEASQRLGINAGQYAIPHPTEPDNAVLAYGAASPHLGCTVGLFGHDPEPGWDDGDVAWLIDPCHQGRWAVHGLGAARTTAQPGGTPLDVVPLRVVDGALWMEAPIKQATAWAASSETTFRLAQ